jgi:hypothetical protein
MKPQKYLVFFKVDIASFIQYIYSTIYYIVTLFTLIT